MLSIYLALIDEPSDKENFEQIYNAYKNMMFRIAMKILNNSSLAEETVQDCFLKILKNLSRFQHPVCSETAHLIAIIVRNASYDCMRKERPGSKVSIDDVPELSAPVNMPDITDALLGGIENVIEIISGIDKIYSDVLMLKYLYGYSNSEISDFLNISAKNTEMRLYRARLILKKKLEESCYEIK